MANFASLNIVYEEQPGFKNSEHYPWFETCLNLTLTLNQYRCEEELTQIEDICSDVAQHLTLKGRVSAIYSSTKNFKSYNIYSKRRYQDYETLRAFEECQKDGILPETGVLNYFLILALKKILIPFLLELLFGERYDELPDNPP